MWLYHVKTTTGVIPRQNHNWWYTTSKSEPVLHHIKIATVVVPRQNHSWNYTTLKPQLVVYHVKITTGVALRQNHNCGTMSTPQKVVVPTSTRRVDIKVYFARDEMAEVACPAPMVETQP